jgi:hypothetical protein
MPVTISGDGVFAGLTTVETVNVLHPDSEDVNIVLADDGSVTLDSIPASIQSAIDGIPQIAGIGSNVVYTERTTTFTTTSTSFTDWTNVTVTITPTSATSKILVALTCPSLANSQDSNFLSQAAMRLVRNSTALFGEARTVRGDGSGTQSPLTLVVLDSPATTSATTYKAQVLAQSGTNSFFRGTITVIEVAA